MWKTQGVKKKIIIIKRRTFKVTHKKIWTWLRKGNLKRETEFLLIAAQNNTIRTNYVKAKIDMMQQNSICKLCGDWWNDQSYNKQMQLISTKRGIRLDTIG